MEYTNKDRPSQLWILNAPIRTEAYLVDILRSEIRNQFY
jgi:hypothetical protein